MKRDVVGLMLVKDEADIIEGVVEHSLTQVDWLIFADNGSTDGTRERVEPYTHDGRVVLIDDPEPAYLQRAKMSALAEMAYGMDAEWVVPIDGDEAWFCRHGRLGDWLMSLDDEIRLAQAVMYDQVPSPDWLDWRKLAMNPLTKVAARCRRGLVIIEGNHRAEFPDTDLPGAVLDGLVVRHAPYRSLEKFISKVRNGAEAYRLAGDRVPVDSGNHKRAWGRLSDEQLEAEWYDALWYADPESNPELTHDPCEVFGKTASLRHA
jgi:glycosyltransferase involved in cell wall biosynthesis